MVSSAQSCPRSERSFTLTSQSCISNPDLSASYIHISSSNHHLDVAWILPQITYSKSDFLQPPLIKPKPKSVWGVTILVFQYPSQEIKMPLSLFPSPEFCGFLLLRYLISAFSLLPLLRTWFRCSCMDYSSL